MCYRPFGHVTNRLWTRKKFVFGWVSRNVKNKLQLSNPWILGRISQKQRLQHPPKIRICIRKTTLTQWRFHTNPCKFLHFWTVVESFPYLLRVQIACCVRRFESHEASENVFNSLKMYKFVWKTTQLGDWVASTKPSNFQLRLRSLPLGYTAKHLQVT